MLLVCLVPGGVLEKVLYQEIWPGDATTNPLQTILQRSYPFRKTFIQNDSVCAFWVCDDYSQLISDERKCGIIIKVSPPR